MLSLLHACLDKGLDLFSGGVIFIDDRPSCILALRLCDGLTLSGGGGFSLYIKKSVQGAFFFFAAEEISICGSISPSTGHTADTDCLAFYFQ